MMYERREALKMSESGFTKFAGFTGFFNHASIEKNPKDFLISVIRNNSWIKFVDKFHEKYICLSVSLRPAALRAERMLRKVVDAVHAGAIRGGAAHSSAVHRNRRRRLQAVAFAG
jgi:hypothetical protein